MFGSDKIRLGLRLLLFGFLNSGRFSYEFVEKNKKNEEI